MTVIKSADITGGGVVDFVDLQVLVDNWLSWKFDPYYSTDADYYADGVIDWRDLEIMCDYWLAAESGTDFEDFAVLANAWLHWQINPYFNESADLNGDDRIDFEDFAVLAQYWLTNGNRGSDDYYYHYDGLGSVTALSDSSGQIVESYQYDVYGQVNTTGSVGNMYFFTGREYDAETGLYYYRARYYGPGIGRFMQTDPVNYKAGLNLYTYTDNNPANKIDPMGLDAYVIYDPHGGPGFFKGTEELGHVDIAVDTPEGGVLVGSARWGDVYRPLPRPNLESATSNREFVRIKNTQLTSSISTDQAIESYIRAGLSEDHLLPIYCSSYSADVLRNAGVDAGYGVTPSSLMSGLGKLSNTNSNIIMPKSTTTSISTSKSTKKGK